MAVVDEPVALRLPVLSPGDSVEEAIQRMRAARRSGVLMSDGETLAVLRAAELFKARKTGMKNLTEVRGVAAVERLGADDAKRGAMLSSRKGSTYAGLFEMMSSSTVSLVVDESRKGAAHRTAVLVSVNRALIQQLAGPADCHCDGPHHHSYEAHHVNDGDPCPRGDGATVHCE